MLINFKNDIDITNYQRLKEFSDFFFRYDIKKANSDYVSVKLYHQSYIIENISNLQNEEKYLDSLLNILQMLDNNAEQVTTFFGRNDYQYLFNGIKNSDTITPSLITLLYVIQDKDHMNHFFSFIVANEDLFFKSIKDILNYSDEENIVSLIIDLLGTLSIIKEFRYLIIEKDLLLDLKKLVNRSNEIDYRISYLYYFMSKYSFDEYTKVFFQQIFPIIQNFCQHQDINVVCKSLETLYSLMDHSPLPQEAIISNSMIEMFIEYLKNHLTQCNSLDILISCIKDEDFPIDLVLNLNLIEAVFEGLELDNEDFAQLSIKLFDIIFQINNQEVVQKVVDICSNYNYLNYFGSRLFKTKIKAIDIFYSLIQKLTPSNSQIICSKESIDFLLNMLFSDDDHFVIVLKITNVLNYLIPLFRNNNEFIAFFLTNVQESGSIDYLIQISNDTKITPDCNDSTISFLQSVEMLKKEIDFFDE